MDEKIVTLGGRQFAMGELTFGHFEKIAVLIPKFRRDPATGRFGAEAIGAALDIFDAIARPVGDETPVAVRSLRVSQNGFSALVAGIEYSFEKGGLEAKRPGEAAPAKAPAKKPISRRSAGK